LYMLGGEINGIDSFYAINSLLFCCSLRIQVILAQRLFNDTYRPSKSFLITPLILSTRLVDCIPAVKYELV
jgi:hypothetical protein